MGKQKYTIILSSYFILLILSLTTPTWLSNVLTIAIIKSIVVCGIIILMRMGLVSFGQGLFYSIGGYAAGLSVNYFGIYDINLILLITIITALALSAFTGILVCKYRDIFFAMITLAFSMVLYALLVKLPFFGSTDGFNVDKISVFGFLIADNVKNTVILLYCIFFSLFLTLFINVFFHSEFGYASFGIRENEIRVEYLGGKVFNIVYTNYILAAIMAGVGGVLIALTTGHVDPDLTYWSTSGEFVFIGLMSGFYNVLGPLVAAIVYELIRTFAYNYFPYVWQMILGISLLLIIIFLPTGILSVFGKIAKKIGGGKWQY